MKYVPTQDYSFLLDENYYVYNHVENEDSLHIYIKSKEHGCICPACGKMSTKLHATYRRKFQDTPIRCKHTFLHANVYKYDCENPDCECKVFMEDLPCIFRLNGTASPRQRKGCPLQTGSLFLINSGYACSYHSVQGGTPCE